MAPTPPQTPQKQREATLPDATPTPDRMGENRREYLNFYRETDIPIDEALGNLRLAIDHAHNVESKTFLISTTAGLLHRAAEQYNINPNAIQSPQDVEDQMRQPNFEPDAARRSTDMREHGNRRDIETSIAGALSAWDVAILNGPGVGWVLKGSGVVPDQAIVVGPSDTLKNTPLTEIQYSLSADMDSEAMTNARNSFVSDVLLMRYRAKWSGGMAWQRLHPFVINHIAEQLFIDCMGQKGLQRVKSIIAGAAKENKLTAGVSLIHAQRADTIIRTESRTLPPMILQVFVNTSNAIKMDSSKDAYFEYRRLLNGVVLITDYNNLVDFCQANPTSAEARTIVRHVGSGGRGKDWTHFVKQYFASRMGMRDEPFGNLVYRNTAMHMFVVRYGGGVLLLLDAGKASSWTKFGVQALDEVLKVFDRHVPEFATLVGELTARVAARLESKDPAAIKYLVDAKLSTSWRSVKSENKNMLDRVREAWELMG